MVRAHLDSDRALGTFDRMHIVAALAALILVPSLAHGQTRRPIPRSLAGITLGTPAARVPGWPFPCEQLGATEKECEVSTLRHFDLMRDSVSAIVVEDTGRTTAPTASEVWRLHVRAVALQRFGPPDSLVAAGERITAYWNWDGLRGVRVHVVLRDEASTYRAYSGLVCRSRYRPGATIADCLAGDRP